MQSFEREADKSAEGAVNELHFERWEDNFLS